MKTPEEMAYEYGEKFDGVEISKNDINIAWYAGYKAAAPQWISVEERLPELIVPVLLMSKDKLPAMIGWMDREDDEEGAIYWNIQYGDGEFWAFGYVTHWMPLPPKPEEQK